MSEPLTHATNSQPGADLLMRVGDGFRLAERTAAHIRSAAVHALSLPSLRDVQALSHQVERLQRMVEELTERQGDQLADTKRKRPT